MHIAHILKVDANALAFQGETMRTTVYVGHWDHLVCSEVTLFRFSGSAFKKINGWNRSTPDQKLELMMTELDQTKMRNFDQKFSKDGLDCRQVIQLNHLQSVSEVGHRQATAWDEDGWLPLLSHWLLHERDHEGGGSNISKLYKSSDLRGTQGP